MEFQRTALVQNRSRALGRTETARATTKADETAARFFARAAFAPPAQGGVISDHRLMWLHLGKVPFPKLKQTLYCVNCNKPISLPMPCNKCGLSTMLICIKCLEKNPTDREVCQRCGAPLASVCNHCKAKNSFDAEFCYNCGFWLKLVCYECGKQNPLDRETCQKCEIPLIQTCSHCHQANALEAEFCWRCGMPLIQICLTCEAFNEIEADTCWRCHEPLNISYYVEIPAHLAEAFSV